jgi:hypothetical protein
MMTINIYTLEIVDILILLNIMMEKGEKDI